MAEIQQLVYGESVVRQRLEVFRNRMQKVRNHEGFAVLTNGAAKADGELAQLTTDKGSEEPAPVALEPKADEPVAEAVGAVALAEKAP